MADRRRRSSKIRVVIAEDARNFRRVLRELLKRRGYTVVGEADSAAAALECVARLEPDAVLLDVGLPDLNGFELAARLRRNCPELAVLMISTNCDYNFYEQSQLSGADGFVPKSELAEIDLSWLLAGRRPRANGDAP